MRASQAHMEYMIGHWVDCARVCVGLSALLAGQDSHEAGMPVSQALSDYVSERLDWAARHFVIILVL